mmetsp:Transcript_146346/g.255596  ORF Transcript_146346/g.255596 Transcript_146346/m.255596 type:complete len:92 (+) Transcript_146346:3-278(+)
MVAPQPVTHMVHATHPVVHGHAHGQLAILDDPQWVVEAHSTNPQAALEANQRLQGVRGLTPGAAMDHANMRLPVQASMPGYGPSTPIYHHQ